MREYPFSYTSDHFIFWSHSLRLVFLHAHKTGGTAIQNALKALVPDLEFSRLFLYPTFSFACLSAQLEAHGLGGYRAFGFVRNPWDRLVSWYAMMCEIRANIRIGYFRCVKCADLRRRADILTPIDGTGSFENFKCSCGGKMIPANNLEMTEEALPDMVQGKFWADFILASDTSFDHFIKRIVTHVTEHDETIGRSQIDTYFTNAKGEVIAEIGRFENLSHDLNRILRSFGLMGVHVPMVNKSSHTTYRDYYTPETREIVGRLCANDIAIFGYEF